MSSSLQTTEPIQTISVQPRLELTRARTSGASLYSPFTCSAPATCGELVQGFLDGADFLINAPITLRTKVSVSLDQTGVIQVQTPGVFTKLTSCIENVLAGQGLVGLGAKVTVDPLIPRGKGLASSTAELTAAIHSTATAAHVHLRPEQITRIILNVDTTDGVYYPGVIMCNHLTGTTFERFGTPPPLSFVVVDTGGTVETESFDRDKARAVAVKNRDRLNAAVNFIRNGFKKQNPQLIAAGASISAIVNQAVLSKPELSILIGGTMEFGGMGVNCAHTGTVLGVMFDPRKTSAENLILRIGNLVGPEKILGTYSLASGGIR